MQLILQLMLYQVNAVMALNKTTAEDSDEHKSINNMNVVNLWLYMNNI